MDLSPEAKISTNANGGKQSDTGTRMDLIPGECLLALGELFAYGAKRYAPDNWKLISADEHYNHLMTHLAAWKSGDTQDDHAGHAMIRAVMFYYMAIHGNK